ncbi:MAG: anion permease [Bacteroidetes bacterium]|nr:anion permease [Bacteroidota bacterium]
MIYIILFGAVLFLAFSNGANDNFKGVATLFGSSTTDYRKAINWATITTLLGSISSVLLAGTLVQNFSGKGLVPDDLVLSPDFAISIALGAAITVYAATKIGMPISTTHSLVGALAGSGVMAVGLSFNFERLGSTFLIPLILSPLMAAVLSLIAYFIFKKSRLALGVTKETCLCIENELKPVVEILNDDGSISLNRTDGKTKLTISNYNDCVEVYRGNIFGISAQKALDAAHFLSSGVVSFARGLNDTPKIVGLLLVISVIDIEWGMLAVGILMAVGGLLKAKKVGHVISKDITPMNSGQGFTANLITGLLVTTASIHGLPVSTTHVSVGSIFGIGTATGQMKIKTVTQIILSWVLTLPVAALFSAGVFLILQQI